MLCLDGAQAASGIIDRKIVGSRLVIKAHFISAGKEDGTVVGSFERVELAAAVDDQRSEVEG